ncbi:MAG: acylphosphatase [Gammaproteobacteria bacterium]|nr:acylphosphatase [Gammaproteobacteria bacterium]
MVVRLTVSGRVQGVWFRASTRDEALRLALRGSVRNLADGRVEIVVAGDDVQVEKLIQWAHKGPPMAAVTDVQIETLSNTAPFETFELIH